MSKPATAPAFVIGDYVPATAPNEYDPAVDALIEAGEGKSLTITAPLGVTRQKDEDGNPVPGNGSRDRLLFQKSANDKGYTARVVGEQDNGDGTVSFTFVLTAKNARAGRPRTAAETGETVEAA